MKTLNTRNLTISLVLLLSGLATSGQIPAGYYNAASSLSGTALKAALHDIIKDHDALSYTTVINALKVTDEDTANTSNVICLYTGWSYPKSSFGNLEDNWNREHVWSASHGSFTNKPPEYTDLHNIRPCDASVNMAKSNRDFSKGTTQYIDGSGPTNCYTAPYTWEPRPEDKGDVARILFYMAVRYEGTDGEKDLELVSFINSSPDYQPYHGHLDTLLKWHLEDPVNDWERNRNDIVYYSYQGNRNPFVDHPEYVDLIWGIEPEDHATQFSANDISLTWTDPETGILPDGYLVRVGMDGFSTIPDPVDGVTVPGDAFNVHVPYGQGGFIYHGALPGNTYYFKVFPYKGAGTMINYKTDGQVQQVMAEVEGWE